MSDSENTLTVSLHTADPGGDVSAHECRYEGYAQVAVQKDGSAIPDYVDFPVCTGGSEVATHCVIERVDGLLSEAFTPFKINISKGVWPRVYLRKILTRDAA